MNPLKVATWNVEGRLSNRGAGQRGTPRHIAHNIIKLQADIIFLPEACHIDGMAAGVEQLFEQAGYQIFTQPYRDLPDLLETDYTLRMALLVRRSLHAKVKVATHRLGGIRQSMVAAIKLPGGQKLHIFGIHLHDKNEQLRLQMAHDVVEYVQKIYDPIVLLGDFNALHGSLWRSRMVRTVFFKKLTAIIPHYKIKYLLERVSEMARGDTLTYILEHTNLREVNIKKRATSTPKTLGLEWLPSIRLLAIDHILLNPALTLSDFRVSADGGADHRAISGRILF